MSVGFNESGVYFSIPLFGAKCQKQLILFFGGATSDGAKLSFVC